MSRIGFIGLGLMGAPMARHLLAAGHEVSLWNRTRGKADALAARGAAACDSPRAVLEASELVHLCVSDTAAVETVALGPEGLIEAAESGGVIVDHSTIDPEATRRIGGSFAEAGLAWVDAPVSGGSAGAEAGSLTVFAGGAAAAVAKASDATACFAKRFTHMGPLGAGQATKLCNQLLVGTAFVSLAEMASLAKRAGVAMERLPEALAGGFGDSALLQRQFSRIAAPDGQLQGTVSTMLKDLNLVAALADKFGGGIPVTALVRELWRLHEAEGRGGQDWVSIAELFPKDRAGSD